MVDATKDIEEPESIEEDGADAQSSEASEPEVKSRAAPSRMLAGRQAARLLGSSSDPGRVMWQADYLGRLYSDPLRDMMRQITAASRAADMARQLAGGSRAADMARQLATIYSAADQHRRLFAHLSEARWQPKLWEGVFPAPGYLRHLTGIAERFKAARALFIPANLSSLSAEDWMQVLELGREEGIALAWVPGTALVRALLDAPDAAAREQLLHQEEAAVLEDCMACLDAVTDDPDMVELAGFVREAVEVCRSGRHASVQALATNVVETMAKHHLDRVVTGKGKGDSSRIRTRFGVPISDSISLDELRVWLVGAPLFAAYREDYDYEKRGAAYNRHGTAHCVNLSVYRPANALRALLLATSMLRLMDEELAEAEEAA